MKTLSLYINEMLKNDYIKNDDSFLEQLFEITENGNSDNVIDKIQKIEKEFPNIKDKVVNFGNGANKINYSWFDKSTLKRRYTIDGVYYIGDEWGAMTDGHTIVVAHVGEYQKEYDKKVVNFNGKVVGDRFPNINVIDILNKKEIDFNKFKSAVTQAYNDNKKSKDDEYLQSKSIIIDDDAKISKYIIKNFYSILRVVKNGSVFFGKTKITKSPCLEIVSDGVFIYAMINLATGDETEQDSIDLRE